MDTGVVAIYGYMGGLACSMQASSSVIEVKGKCLTALE